MVQYSVKLNGSSFHWTTDLAEAERIFSQTIAKVQAEPSFLHYDDVVELLETKAIRRELFETPAGTRARRNCVP